ncbi:hypothetical protein BDV26DRAFT_177353 [Aspergillus bertholletiae]|uniref:Uncharacterized protein n=1 Tax=Aspergillus bertholletiae TaxID=1226010 RepID=A0A5N7BB49_9EURO|nr:hypothetical protein BDV26DRAFT_177353 [Aspergillus bertholletiae]
MDVAHATFHNMFEDIAHPRRAPFVPNAYSGRPYLSGILTSEVDKALDVYHDMQPPRLAYLLHAEGFGLSLLSSCSHAISGRPR